LVNNKIYIPSVLIDSPITPRPLHVELPLWACVTVIGSVLS